MFDIGFWELCLIAVMGLIILGPERLPVALKKVAGIIRKIKMLSRNLTQEIEKELDIADFKRELEQKNQTITRQAKQLADKLGEPVESLTSLKNDLEISVKAEARHSRDDNLATKKEESKTKPVTNETKELNS